MSTRWKALYTHRSHSGTARAVLDGAGVAIDVRLSVTDDDVTRRGARLLGYPVFYPAVVVALGGRQLLGHRVVQRRDPVERLVREARVLVGCKLLVSCGQSGEGKGRDVARAESVCNGRATESNLGA